MLALTDDNVLHLNHGTDRGKALNEVARELEGMNWCYPEFDLEARSAWFVTQLGRRHVQFHQKLVAIGNGLRRREGVELKDLSSYELLCELLEADWKMHVVAMGVKSAAFSPYDALEELPAGQAERPNKLVYVRVKQKKLCIPYLYLLSVADEHGLKIVHLQGPSYYIESYPDLFPKKVRRTWICTVS